MDVLTQQAREDARSERRERDRAAALLWAFGGMVLAVLVVGAIAGGLRDLPPLDPESPEAVAQAYLQAVFDRDLVDARGLLSEASAARCQLSDFRQAWVPESLTASLDDVRVTGPDAEVWVRIRTVSGPGPFGGGDFSIREVLTLAREEGQWRLTGEPWPLMGCRRP
jgi:hypothetical protein